MLGSSVLVAASPEYYGRSISAERESESELFLNERGELDGELYDKRGKMFQNPKINLAGRGETKMLEKRQQPGFNYGSSKVRGVNIGGWLVAEPWITPSLFDDTGDSRVIDEWTFGEYVSDAASRLEHHWATFYTESDFAQIAAAGLNHVRIPIGYWALDKGSSPFIQGNQYNYLKQAVGWARNHGLKVLVDLHGVPGSQNGFDNSGRKISPPRWFNQESYKNRAKAVIQTFANDFASQTDVVTSIELVNEPLTTSGPSNALSFTRDYYNNAYYAARYTSKGQLTNFAVTMHDGFQPLTYWQGAYQPPQYQQVILDTHQYSVFNQDQLQMSNNARLGYFCNLGGQVETSNKNLYTVVGEWTTAPTDCAKYLNGRGIGARYDGTYPGSSKIGSCNGKTGKGTNFSSSYKSFLKQMFDTQRKAYERGTGWIMWTWKTEEAADWDYQRGLQYGWITKNLNSFSSSYC
ncbi:putative EXG1-exo-beta-1,3-glucanase, major isoform [Meira miltonrushii]|uniref:Putative EXG1-exo-beta-1,3-glucanase, major isoform n=1 Tax=Meira miltonrushii TaxID=1280837 RepID=A0A316VB51_9BASI|nr:putative EXG1-exo-beta-1,3-glucanase, major isoform [Meira miltonrushii]PWN34494.1 putative EXG1-exo-beta-1,3-glucanase, major isoform [Meira miltonrushii]